MGMLLDSSVLIAAERRKLSAVRALSELDEQFPDETFGISTVTVMEFAHGETRAETPARAIARLEFLDVVLEAVPAYEVTASIARAAGRLDGDLTRNGLQLGFPDLLIGMTAVELGWSVLTTNVRHFDRIPGLNVLRLR